jgi:hypothetical protein
VTHGLDQKVGRFWMTGFSSVWPMACRDLGRGKANRLTEDDLRMLHCSSASIIPCSRTLAFHLSWGSTPHGFTSPNVVAIVTVHLIRLWFRLKGRMSADCSLPIANIIYRRKTLAEGVLP